jgi:dolichol-phosphate mannosyltransferase
MTVLKEMNVSVVLPTYNERQNVSVVIPRIFSIFSVCGVNGKVIVVDDNSPDGTSEEVNRLSARYDIILITRGKKLGLGSAYIVGFHEALKYSDVIFEMDADLSHSPEEIPNFIEGLNSCDVVLGSRYVPFGRVENWGLGRIVISRAGNLIAQKLLRLRIKDITTGYRAYKKQVLEKIDLDSIYSNGYAFQAEMLHRVSSEGFRILEIPIVFRDRELGESKLSKKEIESFIRLCFSIFFNDLRKSR